MVDVEFGPNTSMMTIVFGDSLSPSRLGVMMEIGGEVESFPV